MAEAIQNDGIKARILEYLKDGVSKKDSAVLSGISEATLYRWVEEDDSFKSQIEASILEYKHTLVKNLVANAEKDGRLALEILSRRYPNEWGVNAVNNDRTEALRKERIDVVRWYEKILQKEHERAIEGKVEEESSIS